MIAIARNGHKKTKLLKVGHYKLSPHDLKPSPENAALYRERNENDSDWIRFIESVRAAGEIQQEILISRDGYIVSGHQRTRAAIEVGLKTVPVRVLRLRRDKHTANEWVKILREQNTGRHKGFKEELVTEKLIDSDPDDAYKNVIDDRITRSTVKVETIVVDDTQIRRSQLSDAKRLFVEAVLKIIAVLKAYWPLSVRQVHYKLLNDPPLKNANNPESVYQNDKRSYKDLSDVLTRLRLCRTVWWGSLSDGTRPVTEWQVWGDSSEFIADQAQEIFKGYRRDLLQSQESHVEIVGEKLTIQGIIHNVAARYGIPFMIGRGFSSIDARHSIARRFEDSGKDRLVLLFLGDADPDGDAIVQSYPKSMRDDFEIDPDDMDGVRIALTRQQAIDQGLPPGLEAKTGSASYDRFVRDHGTTTTYELEAVEPEVLEKWIDDSIRGVLDIEAYNYEVEQQREEAVMIDARRHAIREILLKNE